MPQFNSCFQNSSGTKQDGIPYVEYADGDGAKVIPFPYQHEDDICVYIEDPTGTYTLQDTDDYSFGINNQNKNTITLDTATSNPIHIMRRTDVCIMDAQFEPGASIRAQDLNHDFTQLLYLIQENRRALAQMSGNDNGQLPVDPNANLLWERNGTSLKPVNADDNLVIKGTTKFNGATYTWPSAVAGTTGQVLSCSNTGTLSWVTVATGSSNVSEIETDTGSGLRSGTKGSENVGTATGDVSIVIDNGNGLTFSGNQLTLNLGDGLEFDGANVRVKRNGTTLDLDSDGLSVAVPFDEPTGTGVFGRQSDGTWAAVNTGDITGIDAGDGITISDPDTATPEVSVRLASDAGLEFNSGELRVKINGGLVRDTDGLKVNDVEIWGQSLDMTGNVQGDIDLDDDSILFKNNANTVTLTSPSTLGDTYSLLLPVNTGSDGNYLELQDASTGQMRWGTPTGSGTGGVVNQINANQGLSGGGSSADIDLAVELTANGGLQFSANNDGGTLEINNGTGLSLGSGGIAIDSVTLWNNAHDHSGNIEGTIRLGEDEELQFQDDSSGTMRTGTLRMSNITADQTYTLPATGGTLATTNSTVWERDTSGNPNIAELVNSGDTVRIQSGNLTSTSTDITITPGGTGARSVVLDAINGGNIQLQDNTAVTGTLGATGNVDFDADLTVDGDTTLGNAATDTVTIPGILDVNGRADIDNIRLDGNTISTTTGDLILDSNGGTIDINDDVDISGTLEVDGVVTFNNNLDVTGNLDVDGTTELDGLNVDGDSTFDNVTIVGTLTQTGNVNVDGDLTIESPHNLIIADGQIQTSGTANLTIDVGGDALRVNSRVDVLNEEPVRFWDNGNNDSVDISAPNNLAASYELVWPTAAPSTTQNQVLQSPGTASASQLEWINTPTGGGGSAFWDRDATNGILTTNTANDDLDLEGHVTLQGTDGNAERQLRFTAGNRGTIGAPQIAFEDAANGNYDTGIYSDAADVVNVTIAGTERFGISTTNVEFNGGIDAGSTTVSGAEILHTGVQTLQVTNAFTAGDHVLRILRGTTETATINADGGAEFGNAITVEGNVILGESDNVVFNDAAGDDFILSGPAAITNGRTATLQDVTGTIALVGAGDLDNRYVDVTGDEMSGSLTFTQGSVIDDIRAVPDDDDDWNIQDAGVWTLAANTEVEFPDNSDDPIPGQSGIFVCAGDGITWSNNANGNWRHPGGVAQGGGADTVIPFYVNAADEILLGTQTTTS